MLYIHRGRWFILTSAGAGVTFAFPQGPVFQTNKLCWGQFSQNFQLLPELLFKPICFTTFRHSKCFPRFQRKDYQECIGGVISQKNMRSLTERNIFPSCLWFRFLPRAFLFPQPDFSLLLLHQFFVEKYKKYRCCPAFLLLLLFVK